MNESGPIFCQSFLVSNIVTLNLISMVFSVVDCLIVQVSCSTDTFVFSPIKNRHGERESNHRNKVVLDFIKIEQYEQTITRFHKSTSMMGVEIIAAFLRRMFTPSAWKWNCNFWTKNDSNLEKLFIVLVLSPFKFTNKGFHIGYNVKKCNLCEIWFEERKLLWQKLPRTFCHRLHLQHPSLTPTERQQSSSFVFRVCAGCHWK